MKLSFRCAEMNDDLLKIISLANSSQRKVVGSLGRQTFLLEPGSVYYFESVDDRIFAIREDKVYDCALRLYEIEEKFPEPISCASISRRSSIWQRCAH